MSNYLKGTGLKIQSRTTGYRSKILQFFMRLDYFQLILMAGLLTYGVAFIYGTGYQSESAVSQDFWIRQLIWIGIGMGVWLAMALMNYRHLGYWSAIIYGLSILLLILVLFVGEERYGAKRWLDFHFFNFQPSETAKLGYLCLLSWLITLGMNINHWKNWFILGLLTLIPVILIFKEPDLGSSLIIVFILAVILFASGIRWRWILLAFSLLIIAVPIVYPNLKPYHLKRIEAFINPDSDPLGSGWNARQAEMSVGSGGIAGKGFTQGTLHTLGYLPKTVANNDFIFSVIAEETGFIGSSIFVLFYFLLVTTALRTAAVARDTFGRLLAVGIAGIFFMHSMVNIGMNIRLSPVTGIPLPLVSYGGSFMVVTLAYLGILQSIYLRRRKSLFSDEPESPVSSDPDSF